MDGWENCFDALILERGRNYFAAGNVIMDSSLDDGWRATVCGSENYQVFVPKSGDVEQAVCTCPHYAGGNLCKHIAAVMFAVEAGETPGATKKRKTRKLKADAEKAETVEDILDRLTLEQLRSFVLNLASDDGIERTLRAQFGRPDAKQAKQSLQQTTTSLTKRHERGGFIDWRHATDFEFEYRRAVEEIVQPLFNARDVDGLIDLAVVRLVQLQRVCIDDSDGFFTDAMYDVWDHLAKTYEWGSGEQRRRLFAVLNAFLQKNPGRDRGGVYWFEQDVMQEFVTDRFADDPAFAPELLDAANARIKGLPPDVKGPNGYDRNESDRRSWKLVRLRALAAMGASYEELLKNADELMEVADAVNLLADAAVSEGDVDGAIELLTEGTNARPTYRVIAKSEKTPLVFERLIDLVKQHRSERELAELRAQLLLAPPRDAGAAHMTEWFADLKESVGEEAWPAYREKMLDEMPVVVSQLLLAHEGATEELFQHIVAHDGVGLETYEKLLVEAHPEPYVSKYLRDAAFAMEHAYERKGYQRAVRTLAHAAGIEGGQDRAQELAESWKAAYPRKTAMLDELKKAGF